MSQIILPPEWRIPESQTTPESVFTEHYTRRALLKKTLGTAFASALMLAYGGNARAGFLDDLKRDLLPSRSPRRDYPSLSRFKPNPMYRDAGRPLSDESAALSYNNFYEFTAEKDEVWTMTESFKDRPWKIEISGLVENPGVYEIDDLIRMMALEERIYRHRCVEAWAMTVPWIGFPLKDLIKKVQPQAKAGFVRLVSFHSPEIAPGQKRNDLPWPYTEGLTLAEAMNELAFLAVGIYGHRLPGQHGAPIRLVIPWKYGYKSIKSIVKIEFTDFQPATFWSTLIPHEYPFESNVDPNVPHPRWSQRREKMIGTGEIFETQKYNGYARQVAYLYK